MDTKIELGYTLSPEWPNPRYFDDPSDDTWLWRLMYDMYLGDFTFRIGSVDLSSRPRGWVPIVDFAVRLRDILRSLPREPRLVFVFTESDDTIQFSSVGGGIVEVKASYVKGVAFAPLAQLLNAADDFCDSVLNDLRDEPVIRRLRHRLS